jgi:hypothetical protein
MHATPEDAIGFVRNQSPRQRNYLGHGMKAKGRRHERRKVREALHQYVLGSPEVG